MILRLTVGGMHAVHARRAVETALSAVRGIRALDVSLGRVEVELEQGADTGGVASAIAAAGFEVLSTTTDSRRLHVLGPDATRDDG